MIVITHQSYHPDPKLLSGAVPPSIGVLLSINTTTPSIWMSKHAFQPNCLEAKMCTCVCEGSDCIMLPTLRTWPFPCLPPLLSIFFMLTPSRTPNSSAIETITHSRRVVPVTERNERNAPIQSLNSIHQGTGFDFLAPNHSTASFKPKNRKNP